MNRRQPSRTNPVRQLIDEHEIFMEALSDLRGIMLSLPVGADHLSAETLMRIEEIWHGVNEHLNVHFVKEEEAFFPMIERLIPGARVKFQFLHVDHDRLRENFEDFTIALQDCRAHGASAHAVATLRRVGEEMVRWFSYHIVAEDTIYFEIAEKELNAEDAREVLGRMERIESMLREIIAPISTERISPPGKPS